MWSIIASARPPPFVVLANNPHPKFQGADIDDENTKGIIPRIIEQIFQSIMISPANMEFTVKVSYMEIYMEKVRDLLNRKFLLFTQLWSKYATNQTFLWNLHISTFFFCLFFYFCNRFYYTAWTTTASQDNLPIHEDKSKGVYVKGLLEVYVSSTEEVYEVMRRGSENRVVASTSKSAHFFFLLYPRICVYQPCSQCSHLYVVRHERRKFSQSLDRHDCHHTKEPWYRCSKER